MAAHSFCKSHEVKSADLYRRGYSLPIVSCPPVNEAILDVGIANNAMKAMIATLLFIEIT